MTFARALRDEGGAALLLFTIMLPVLMGLIALSVDAGRYMMLNTELQDMADAAALAAAGQLDRKSDSIARAVNAAREKMNEPRWSNVGLASGDQAIKTITFATNQPNLMSAPLDQSSAADSKLAAFVEVVTESRTLLGSFIAAVSTSTSADTSARAVAGSTYVACAVTPLMMCNPNEDSKLPFDPLKGTMFRLKENGKSQGKSWSPGDFGLLDPSPDLQESTKSKALRVNLARSNPNFCYNATASPKPGGNAGPTEQGFNLRFDRFDRLPGNKIPSEYAGITPAGNVLKGIYPAKGSAKNPSYDDKNPCNFPSSANSVPVPRDACFYAGNCNSAGSIEWGAPNTWRGTAQATEYWNRHHNGTAVSATYRFELYDKELSTNVPGKTDPEPAVPACAKSMGQSGVGGIERRYIYVAVVNCKENGIKGSYELGFVPDRFAKFYVTEPAGALSGGGNQAEIYGEFIEMIEVNDSSGKLRHIVQLYE